MKIRVIQLINNFFRDADFGDENRTKALGTYCTFGYFDALQVEEGRDFSSTGENLIWKKTDAIAVDTFDGTYSRRNLVCMADDEERDKKFWDSAAQYPYLFVSLIRMRHASEDMGVINRVIEETKEDQTAIAYYSYNHSELVTVKLEKCYFKGMEFVLSLREQLRALSIYSIFSVRDDVLRQKTKLRDEVERETVSVRLRMMIKNDQKIDAFLQELRKKLFGDEIQEGASSQGSIKKFYILGSSDLVVEIENIEMHELLSCYGMGNLLTHTNEQFGETVYNIETEILVKGERIEHGQPVDSRGDGET